VGHPRHRSLAVRQHPPLPGAQREHAPFEPEALHLLAEHPPRLLERHGGAVVRLEVDGDQVARAHVREDLQRLLRTGMVAIAAAGRREGPVVYADTREAPTCERRSVWYVFA